MNVIQGEMSDDISGNLTTQVVELCLKAKQIENLATQAEEILKILHPTKPLFNTSEPVLVMINEYTFYRTSIIDVRYYRHNDRGLSVTEIEYKVLNNSYDHPMETWVSQNKIFKSD